MANATDEKLFDVHYTSRENLIQTFSIHQTVLHDPLWK